MDETIKTIRLLQYRRHLLTQIYSNFGKSTLHNYESILENFNIVNPLDDNKSKKCLVLIDNSGFELYKIITKTIPKQQPQPQPPVSQLTDFYEQTPLMIDEYNNTNLSHFTSDYVDDEIYDDILEIEKMYADNNYNLELDLALSISMSYAEEENKITETEEILDTVTTYEPILNPDSKNYILFDIDKCNEQSSFEYEGYLIKVKQEIIDRILEITSTNSFLSLTELALKQ